MSAGLTLEPSTHVYRLGATVVPGVSEILEALGFNDFVHVDPATLAEKRALGQRVHLATAYHDRGTLDYASVDHAVLPYVQSWRKFRGDFRGELVAIETPLYDPVLNCAGTPDRIFAHTGVARTRGSLIDLKIGVYLPKHRLQSAAYVHMWNEQGKGTRVTSRATCYLDPHGFYTLIWHEDLAGDLAAFAAARQLYEWRKKYVRAAPQGDPDRRREVDERTTDAS
jgi:hypothetical protein